jgi:copper chaperone CopZ
MMAVTVGVPGLTGRSDVRLVSARLRDVPGVLSVEVDAAAGVVVVRGSVDAPAVRAALLEVGYLPEPLTD